VFNPTLKRQSIGVSFVDLFRVVGDDACISSAAASARRGGVLVRDRRAERHDAVARKVVIVPS
jgi:hypothetical protein